jgi:hypothetical protein
LRCGRRINGARTTFSGSCICPSSPRVSPSSLATSRDQAFVKIAGQHIWLGRYGEPITQEKYDRLVGEWLADGRSLPRPPPPPDQPPTILEVLAPYSVWAKQLYTQAEAHTIRAALRIVEQLYGSLPSIEFGPDAMRAVRAA